MLYQYEKLTSQTIYKLMSQTIVPRPIAWIVTQSERTVNVAPFSYFTALSSTPPALLVSIGHKPDGAPKDTLANIRATKRATLCLVDPNDLEKMHFSSKALAANESEAQAFDIPLKALYEGYPPMVATTPSAFFCDFLQEIDLEGPTVPVVLKIRAHYLDEAIITDQERLTINCTPLARVGRHYALLGEQLEAPKIL